jgi:uncharacterized protein (DUF433 family)
MGPDEIPLRPTASRNSENALFHSPLPTRAKPSALCARTTRKTSGAGAGRPHSCIMLTGAYVMTLIAPRIAADPAVHFGKPVIEGTRVPVSVVVGAVAAGDSWQEIAREYGVTEDDVRAALAYAANRLEEETVRAAF